MSDTSRDQVQSYSRSNVAVYMQQVYLWMTVALGVTAFAAEGVAPGFAASEAAWKRFWDSVHDFALPDPEMLRMVHVALYHLRCNATRWSQPVGIHNDLWSGKFFAFDEFFCHMGLLTSGCTELARRIPEFRRATLTVAQKRCNPFHSKEPVFGGLYPWETLEDGSNCTFPGHWEDHIFQNANSAAGAWAQFLTMRDRDFLEQTAWPILRDMARYYVSHHVYREADGGVFIGKVTDLEKLGSAPVRRPGRRGARLRRCGDPQLGGAGGRPAGVAAGKGRALSAVSGLGGCQRGAGGRLFPVSGFPG